MGRLFCRINDDLDKKFNVIVSAKFGRVRGALTSVIEEALKLWIEENRHFLDAITGK